MRTRTTSVFGTRLPTLHFYRVAHRARLSLRSGERSTVNRSVVRIPPESTQGSGDTYMT